MNELQKGDIIENGTARAIVLARLEDLVFIRDIFPTGAKGHVSNAIEIDDLIVMGFTKEEEL